MTTDQSIYTDQPGRPKVRRWPWIVGIVVAFIVGIGIGAVGAGDDTEPTATTDNSAEIAELQDQITELEAWQSDWQPIIDALNEAFPVLESDPEMMSLLVQTILNVEPELSGEPESSYVEPTAEDFQLEVKVVEQSCFGSAGCNITYRIDVGADLAGELDPDKTYELTYQLEGTEPGYERIGTITIEGDTYTTEENRTSIESPDDELTAVVLDVRKLGL